MIHPIFSVSVACDHVFEKSIFLLIILLSSPFLLCILQHPKADGKIEKKRLGDGTKKTTS